MAQELEESKGFIYHQNYGQATAPMSGYILINPSPTNHKQIRTENIELRDRIAQFWVHINNLKPWCVFCEKSLRKP